MYICFVIGFIILQIERSKQGPSNPISCSRPASPTPSNASTIPLECATPTVSAAPALPANSVRISSPSGSPSPSMTLSPATPSQSPKTLPSHPTSLTPSFSFKAIRRPSSVSYKLVAFNTACYWLTNTEKLNIFYHSILCRNHQ